MSLTEALGAFTAGLTFGDLPEAVRRHHELHVFDSIGAALAGSTVPETLDVRDLVAATYGDGPALAIGASRRTSVPAAALLGAVAARCSEIDDIHLRGCITPGSLIVPVAVALASADPSIDGDTFLAACAAGTEVLVRLGVAVDGPRILYRDLWPTYLCAPMGVAATVARLLSFDAAQTADAIGIAASLATGTTGRPAGKTSRWLTMGCAVQNGVIAALGARRGMRGDTGLLDGRWSAILGIALDAEALVDGLGVRYEAAASCIKPWCAAKQTIAATDAFRALLREERLDPRGVRDIVISVPAAYRAMIDKPALPRVRQESFASVQYQLALAAFAPDKAYDVARTDIASTADVARLMSVTSVVAEARLDAAYPAAWPARVALTTSDGVRLEREVMHPLGDPGTPFGSDLVRDKIVRSGGVAPSGVDGIAAATRALRGAPSTGPLIAAIAAATRAAL
jgi:2-methylcitrate dehydratase PrpD